MNELLKYDAYPYKRLYVTAIANSYPLDFIEKLISKFKEDEKENRELYIKMVITRIKNEYNTGFTNEEEFYGLSKNIYNNLNNKNTYIGYALRHIIK